jgi:hypothetical protein
VGTGAASIVGTGEGGEMEERAGATGGGRNGKEEGGLRSLLRGYEVPIRPSSL